MHVACIGETGNVCGILAGERAAKRQSDVDVRTLLKWIKDKVWYGSVKLIKVALNRIQ